MPLVNVGIVEKVHGGEKTSRPIAHARPVTIWRLRDRAGAERWLADHPDRDLPPLPDDPDDPA